MDIFKVENKTVCNFCENNKCRVFSSKTCNGYSERCKSFKTHSQFVADTDKAITRCRELHLCDGCKYRKVACLLSSEERSDEV